MSPIRTFYGNTTDHPSIDVSEGQLCNPANIFFRVPDIDTKIWRYMDFPKFCSLLSESSLFFCAVDRLSDPFEGSMTHYDTTSFVRSLAEHGLRPEDLRDPNPPLYWRAWYRQFERTWTFVNCWHANEYESATLYSVYGVPNQTIAIQSTIKRLMSCLKRHIKPGPLYRVQISEVNYIDYHSESPTELNTTLAQFFYKSTHYMSENEIRVVIQDLPFNEGRSLTNNDLDLQIFSGHDTIQIGETRPDRIVHYDLARETEVGRYYKADLSTLIEQVYVDYRSDSWFLDVVSLLVKDKFGLNVPVTLSRLAETPVYGV